MIMSMLVAWGMALSGVLAAPHRFLHITTNEGLPHQQVQALAFDRKGALWISTRNGLGRYDGYEVKVYRHDPTDTLSLSHNFVTHLLCDSQGRLWLSTDAGICRYDAVSDSFRRYDISRHISSITETSDGRIIVTGDRLFLFEESADRFNVVDNGLPHFILSSASAPDGRVFLATNFGLFYLDSTLSRISSLDPALYSDFLTGADGIVPLEVDRHNRLWIGRNGKGLMRMDLATGAVERYNDPRLNTLVRTICEDKERNIWLGTENGIVILKPDNSLETIQQDFTDNSRLNDNAVYTIVCDSTDNIWTGTYFGGINALIRNGGLFHTIRPGNDGKSLSGKAVRQLIEPRPGEIWIATEDGGLNMLDVKSGSVRPFTAIPEIGINIHSLFHDKEGNAIWIGTFRNGLFRYDLSTGRYKHFLPGNSSGLRSDAVFDMIKLDDGSFWVATTLGLYKYDRETDRFLPSGIPGLDDEFVYGLKTGRKGRDLWIATRNKGVFKMDGDTRETVNWNAGVSGAVLLDNYIPSLLVDSRGTAWIGTNNFGLFRIPAGSTEVERVVPDPSLATSCVCGLIEDDRGIIWITTSEGLLRYDPATNLFSRFTSYNGLPTNQFNFQSGLQASDGNIYAGTVNGLVTFDPSSLSSSARSYEVHLNSLLIGDRVARPGRMGSPLSVAIDDTDSLTLDFPDAQSFTVEYGVVNPASVGNINYQVKLVGVDKEWRNVGRSRQFTGMGLRPGSYTLLIRANESDYGWDDLPVRALKIKVLPPFYATWWAFLVYILVAAGLLYLLWCYLRRRQRLREREHFAKMENEQALKLNEAKIEFFTEVSHELKTPLSLISAPLRKMEEVLGDSPETRKYLEPAIRNADKLTGIIDQLVTFNKVESGTFKFYVEKGNPMLFIERLGSLFLENAATAGITLLMECEDNGEEVWFSPLYTELIVSNLLSNALKFTARGGKVVLSAKIVSEHDCPYLDISVADNGIGIDPSEHESIFEKFYQTRRGFSTNHKGWGIGLPLVKRLSEIHKGSVSLDSARGRGSTFKVSLCVDPGAFPETNRIGVDKTVVPLENYSYTLPLRRLDSQSQGEVAESQRPKMLIVEDEADLRNFLSDLFEESYVVTVAENGRDALDKVAATGFDIIISDVMMPEIDGIELCRRIKGDVSTSHIPVVLLTAKSDSEDVVKGYMCGAEAYVAKPFDPRILALQVQNIMKMSRRRLEMAITSSPEEKIEDDSLNQLDRDFINALNRIIDGNIDNPALDVAYLTAALGFSRTLLYTKMKSLLGVSIGDYIRKKRMAVAKEMLRKGNNVSETAYSTGFSDPGYFSKVFRKEFGVSPKEFMSGESKS